MKESGKASTKMLLSIAAGGFISLLVILLTLNYFSIISLQNLFYPGLSLLNQSLRQIDGNRDPEKIIAQVGNETIYQKDLDQELASYPMPDQETARKVLLAKIVKDSVILQAAHAEGWIKLDESVFNSLKKDYMERTKLVNEVMKIFENRQASVKGNIISIWFNNIYPGPAGYVRGKEIAMEKITSLHARVKNKTITTHEAAQEIIRDRSLEQVDASYASNAILSFNAGPKETISFDPGFDDLIRNLSVGDVSDVYLAKDEDGRGGGMIDAVYMFAQITEKEENGLRQEFDEWYTRKERAYAVTYN
jgi:hypothetical protein